MQDPRAREQTIARLLAKGVSAEEIAQIAADDAAHEAMVLARAQVKRVQEAVATSKRPRTAAANRRTTALAIPPAASSRPTTPPPPAPRPAAPTPATHPSAAPAPPAEQVRYRIRNWKAYNQGLVQRGSLTIWFDAAAIQSWRRNERTGLVGAPTTYADSAIVCALTLKAVYHLKLRQTEGSYAP